MSTPTRNTAEGPAPHHGVSRRAALVGGVAVTGGGAGASWSDRRHRRFVRLHSETVALEKSGTRVLISTADLPRLTPGSRAIAAPGDGGPLARENDWLATLPGLRRCGDDAAILRAAAQDIYVLSHDLPAAVAGWSYWWRFSWPRDTAHVAVALAALGRRDLARAQLDFLAGVQRSDGDFEARYSPWTGRPPDRRPRQLDGCGWYLWALWRVGGDDPEWLREHRTPAARAIRRIVASLDGAGRPPVVPDFWELMPQAPTLGTSAVLLSGLEHGAALAEVFADPALASACRTGHARLARSITRDFAARDYPREIGGRDPDAAVTFLSPLYQSAYDPPRYREALQRYEERAQRPAGGVAPGAGWTNDGVSWTPQVALLANAYAAVGQHADSARLCAWLAEHRTRAGSFPEKVLYDGSPAEVAPLVWTASLVAVTLLGREPGRCT